jgi:hypothetical protein
MPGVTVTARVTMLERGRRYYVLGGKLPLINSLARRRCGDPVKGAAECASVPTLSGNAPLLKMDDTTLLLELRRSMMLFRFENCSALGRSLSRRDRPNKGRLVYLTTSAGLPAVW